MFRSFGKENRYIELCRSAQICTLCERLCDRNKVLSLKNGDINSKVLFIAEAPGRLGADRTMIPLYGDRTGDNFEILLGNIGWSRQNIFITNSVLCNPREKKGNNAPPTVKEIFNCSPYLEMTIRIINPDVIVTLGQKALLALKYISNHNVELKSHVATEVMWDDFILFPMYHPGPRALIHRSLTKQRSDYIKLSKIVDAKKGIKAKKKVKAIYKEFTKFHQLTKVITQHLGKISYFKLGKLMYLVDYKSIETIGCSVTNSIYLRREDGPWSPDLQEMVRHLDKYEILMSYNRKIPFVEPGPVDRFDIQISDEEFKIIYDVIEKYGSMTNANIKTAAYLTKPMKYILYQEKTGKKMTNKPVINRNKYIYQLEGEE